MKTDREVLEEAIALLDSPERWTQGSLACDATGETISRPTSRQAKRWCVMGALHKVTKNNTYRDTLRIQRVVAAINAEISGHPLLNASLNVMEFNDNHSYDEVMLAMKRGLDHLA